MGAIAVIVCFIMFVCSSAMFLMAQNYLKEVRLIRKDINEFRRSLIRIVAERKRRF